jgi:hypothetical protein
MPAWSQRVPGRNGPKAFPAPDVSKVTLPGNPAGLFPRASLDSGITLQVTTWDNLPAPGETEFIKIQITSAAGVPDYVTVATVEYIQGTTTLPFDITIPADYLLKDENEGAHLIRFEHENWVGTPVWSSAVPVYIDKVPPHGTATPGKITFSIAPPFTDAKLSGLTDVEGTIPAWAGAAEGDKVAFAWIKDKVPEDPNLIVPIDVVTLGPDRKVKFPASLIRSLGDGGFFGVYTIFDKALNRSRISLYDVIPVALGEFPPSPYPPLSVPEAADGSVDRQDALQGVHVEFAKILKAKDTDEIAIIWAGEELKYRTPVGSNPSNPMSVAVNWEHMRDKYGIATGPVSTTIEYKLYRGIHPLGGATGTVMVDFSLPGPGNPAPEPGNPALLPLDVLGDSKVANKLVAGDENKRVYAEIELYDPLADGDVLQVLWNGKPIGAPRPIDTTQDTAGDKIEIDLEWDVIRREGNHTEMPVTYRLTNPAHPNPQEPKEPTKVEITFLTVTLPVALPQGLFNGRLTCRSLHYENGTVGFRYLIPPSEYLKAGMTVDVEWKAYHTYASPVLVPAAGDKKTLGPISADEETNGVIWFIEPYAKHLLPTWGSSTNQTGKGEVIYILNIRGVDVPSAPSDTQVVLSAGSGTCTLTP